MAGVFRGESAGRPKRLPVGLELGGHQARPGATLKGPLGLDEEALRTDLHDAIRPSEARRYDHLAWLHRLADPYVDAVGEDLHRGSLATVPSCATVHASIRAAARDSRVRAMRVR